MQTKDYLQYIVEKIHSTVFATVDGEGRPVTCAIDMMDYDESGLYFLTAKGKNFYDRLKSNENIAFTAMKGEDTLSCIAVSVQGRAKEIGPDRLARPKQGVLSSSCPASLLRQSRRPALKRPEQNPLPHNGRRVTSTWYTVLGTRCISTSLRASR